jgi:predicted dehydrogenase
MSLGHTKRLMRNPDVQVVGVCDPNRQKREKFKGLIEDGYASQAGLTRYKGCADYNDFRDLLANKDVDAIWVVTPDHWHVIPALAAIRMGKAAYVEKPLTLTIEEGRVLADEVKRTGGIIQCGSQQRSTKGFVRVVELVRNGRIGKLQRVEVGIHPGDGPKGCTEQPVPDWLDHDLWLGQAPLAPYCPERCLGVRPWISIRDYGGGRIASWGSHHLDIVQWALDADNSGPVKIEGSGTFPVSGIVNHAITWDVDIQYASGVTVHLMNTPPPNPYIKFMGEEGSIFITRQEIRAEPANLLDSVIGPDEFHARTSDNHSQNFLDCIRPREEPVASAEIAHRSATVCHLVNNCLILGRSLRWNPQTERFVNDPEADAMISRKMRAPWHL